MAMTKSIGTLWRVVVLLAILAGNLLVPMAQVPMVYAEEQVYVTPKRIGTHNVPEASGIVASRVYPGIYWMISDWGNPANLYAVDGSGHTVKVFAVEGVTGYNDWEDIAIDENNNIWIANIGDNTAFRSSYWFYKVPEPDPYGEGTNVSATAYHYVYPDGSRDSNGAFVWQGIPYVIDTKPDKARVYNLPVLDPNSTAIAQLAVTYTGANWVWSADISTDGRRLALVSMPNKYALIIERSSSSTDVKDFFTSPTRQWRISFDNRDIEGITFIPGKYDFVMENEDGGFWKVTQDQYENTATITLPPVELVFYMLQWENYDAENVNEVSVLINDQLLLTYPRTESPANNNTWIGMSMDITDYVVIGNNTIVFRENGGSGKIRNVVIIDIIGKVILRDSAARSFWTPDNRDVRYSFTFPLALGK